MGPCQGRLCGITVTQILAESRHETPQQIGAYRARAPAKQSLCTRLADCILV
ncbi:hypothetical protein [Paraburkholderia madseniana]|uniref:hypothetical protein n=1 Tax=Paraburkholderia madseniana TaxID=2599607 RepID=UPI0035574B3E